MRDYGKEKQQRIAFIKRLVQSCGASGIVYGNSGGKDSALVGILCKAACENTVGILLPCESSQQDKDDAKTVANLYNIETRQVDLTASKAAVLTALKDSVEVTKTAAVNIAPRLRMIALYAVAASENRLVAGTGNRSEAYMGYFTKWGDGAYDFNPIADLTVTEIYEFLAFLNAPEVIMTKAPSAGLFEGQTDEGEMGISYKSIDAFLVCGIATEADKAVIDEFHNNSEHKRNLPVVFCNE